MMFRRVRCLRHIFHPAALAAWAIVWAVAPARAVTRRPVSMAEVIDKSDQIFIATVEAREVIHRRRNIITVIKLRPSDVWKGKMPVDKDGTLTIEHMGGSLGAPLYLSQYVGTAPATMVAGEQVLLFTRTQKADPNTKGRQPFILKEGNLNLVHSIKGRYSVLVHPDTGEKHIIRPNLAGRGLIPNEASVRRYINAMQKKLSRMNKMAVYMRKASIAEGWEIRDLDTLDEVRDKVQEYVEQDEN